MPTASRAKHKFCRRIGSCLWGDPKCPSVKRPYAAGPHGKGKRVKLSTYGELQLEKQKLRNYYAISEKQLQIAYAKAKAGSGQTDEKLFRFLAQRLDALVYHAGFAPTIFAAKQIVNHGHILVDGKRIDRSSCFIKGMPSSAIFQGSQLTPLRTLVISAWNSLEAAGMMSRPANSNLIGRMTHMSSC